MNNTLAFYHQVVNDSACIRRTVVINLLADFIVFAFFGAGLFLEIQCFDCFCCLSSKCSSGSMFNKQLYINAETFGLPQKSAKSAIESTKHSVYFALWANAILRISLSYSIFRAKLKPVASINSRTLTRRLLKTISRILSIIFGVVTSSGRFEWCSSFVDVHRHKYFSAFGLSNKNDYSIFFLLFEYIKWLTIFCYFWIAKKTLIVL